jgi:hypothetical protein
MFHPLMSLFIAVLFFVLTPGIFLSLPANSSFRMKAMFHAVVFALVYHVTHKMVWNAIYGGYSEYFDPDMPKEMPMNMPQMDKKPHRAPSETDDVPY